MQQAEIIRAVHILQREGWDAEKILAFILEVSGDTPTGEALADSQSES